MLMRRLLPPIAQLPEWLGVLLESALFSLYLSVFPEWLFGVLETHKVMGYTSMDNLGRAFVRSLISLTLWNHILAHGFEYDVTDVYIAYAKGWIRFRKCLGHTLLIFLGSAAAGLACWQLGDTCPPHSFALSSSVSRVFWTEATCQFIAAGMFAVASHVSKELPSVWALQYSVQAALVALTSHVLDGTVMLHVGLSVVGAIRTGDYTRAGVFFLANMIGSILAAVVFVPSQKKSDGAKGNGTTAASQQQKKSPKTKSS